MRRVCVVTSKSGAYYSLVSRLRRAEVPFESLLPDSDVEECEVILTTAEEAVLFGDRAITLEELDENPGVFKGQILARLGSKREPILIGVDPGKRTGLAVFLGKTRLASSAFVSVHALRLRVGSFARKVPSESVVIRIGDGNRALALRLAEAIEEEVPDATIEVVDEKGTSYRSPKMKGVQGDAAAASKIAFRRGVVVNRTPRSRA
ncbi:MAG TPA: hypothetical protein VFE91_00405 [Nitrososphaerales archaeon]|nr:hypothetical protein [Nitrososphaerales archaeon]